MTDDTDDELGAPPIDATIAYGNLRDAAPALLEALQDALAEIEYHHSDMLTEEERNHPRGSGWARVYDKGHAAIALAERTIT